MSTRRTFVIVGTGLAGTSAAEMLREKGFDGHVVMIGAEKDLPYDRPPLSKGYLAGTATREEIALHGPEWYWSNEIELYSGVTATRLDPVAREVEVRGGQRIRFDKLLLATGSSPRRLNVPGSDLAGVHYLRKVEDSDALRADLSSGDRRVAVVGGGWIGLEVAAAARTYGNEVTVIEAAPSVLRSGVGEELGIVFADLHRSRGVRLYVGETVEQFTERDGAVASVLTSSSIVTADVVVVGVGSVPEFGLAQRAGLAVDDGVLVDQYLRTNHPDICAAGDIARYWNPLLHRRIRVEHWNNARRGGAAAASTMLGTLVPYDDVPYFYTDQYDLAMEYSGSIGPDGYDAIVIRGDLQSDHFLAFWLLDGHVQAGMNVNTWDVNDAISALVRSGRRIDPDRLADPTVPLDSLVSQAVA